MRVGIFGGGFKPFTTGHYSMLSVAMAENDLVVLYYALSARKKGSDFVFTKQMAQEIYDIVKPALERQFGNKIRVVLGSPTPILKTFSLIDAVKNAADNDHTNLSDLGIDPDSVERLTVYGDENDIKRFTSYLGTEKEERYFGNLIKTGRLTFDSWRSEDAGSIERVVNAMRVYYPDFSASDLNDIMTVRGSVVRSIVSNKDRNRLARYLPNFLTEDEKDEVIAILFKGLPMAESVLREFVRAAMAERPLNEALEAHILNFYEDLDMPLGELYEVIDAVVAGDLEDVQEKMDGQNITFTVIDGELLFFSKGAKWTSVQRGGANRSTIEVKYQHIDSVREAFLMAYDALDAVVQRNPANAQKLFKNGHVLVSSELLAPKNANTIIYEKPSITFIKPEAVGPDATVDQAAYNQFVADAQKEVDNLEQRVEMGLVPLLKLNRALKSDFLIDEIKTDLDQLLAKTGMSPDQTVGELAVHLLEKKLVKLGVPDSIRDRVSYRFATGIKKGLTKKDVVSAEGIEAWKQLQMLEKNRRTLLGEALIPLESIIQKIGVLAFRNLEFALASNDKERGEDLRNFVKSVRSAFEEGRIVSDQVQLEKIRVALDRIGDNADLFEKAVEGIVFKWRGKTRKLTGMFTPINKLRGFFHYGKEPARIQEPTEENLRRFIRMVLRS